MATVEKLENLDSSDCTRWGTKAAALARLVRRGYNIPSAVVLEALPHELTEEDFRNIALTAAILGAGPLAVRSSSANEDRPESAAAGRYLTTLHVLGDENLRAAVSACRMSADGFPMAVIIQKQVPATAAGVAFSVNPVTGDPGQALVSAVQGLGDKLVSGEATPEEWTVTADPCGQRAEPCPCSARLRRSGWRRWRARPHGSSERRRISNGRWTGTICSCSRPGPSRPWSGPCRSRSASRQATGTANPFTGRSREPP